MLKNKSLLFYHFLVFLIIIFSSIINRFPNDLFFSSGDMYQVFNYEIWYEKYSKIIMGDGLGIINKFYSFNLYYIPFFFIADLFNLSVSEQSSLHQFIFLYSSFVTFYFFSNILFPNLSKIVLIILSFCYAYNIITFSFFWYTWAYTPIKLFYVLLPAVFAIFYKFLDYENYNDKLKILLVSSPLFFLLNIPFSNLSYLVFMFIFFNFFFVYKYFFLINLNIKVFKKQLNFLLIFWIFVLIIISSSLINFFVYVDHENLVNLSGWYNKLQWIKDQAATLPKPFYLHENYQEMRSNMRFFPKLSIIYYVLIIFLILRSKKINKEVLIVFSFLLILIFFHNKGQPYIGDYLTSKIFTETILYAFRSSDKVHTYYPFLIFFIFLLLFNKKKINKIVLSLIVVTSLGSSYPLLIGGIKTKYDLLVSKNKSFKDEDIVMLKSISKDLVEISGFLNSEINKDNYNVVNLPFTGMNSPNWSTYYKNKHVGVDPFNQLFNHRIISLNMPSTALMSYFGRNWNLSKESENWTKLISKIFSSKYIIYHKDTHDFLVEEGNIQIKKYLDQDAIEKIYSGNDIELYLIREPYIEKKIYVADMSLKIKNYDKIINALEASFDKIYSKKFYFEIDENLTKNHELNSLNNYNKTKINSLKSKNSINYTFSVENINENFDIVFTNIHSKFWSLECLNCKNKRFDTKQKIVNGYLNGWTVSTNQEKLDLKIEYSLQKYLDILVFISFLLTIGFFLLGIILYKNINLKKRI